MTHIRSVEFVKEKERTRVFTTDLHTPLPKSARKTNVGLAVKNLSLLKTISCRVLRKKSQVIYLCRGSQTVLLIRPSCFFKN